MAHVRRGGGILVALLLFVGWAAPAAADPWMGHLLISDPLVWPQGRSGNYGTVKYFIDETQNDALPIEASVEVWADGRPPADLEVQVFTNLGRRDFAKVFEPLSASGQSNSYWQPVAMNFVGSRGNNHLYRAALTVNRTGAYRLTTRFRINGGPWLWHNQFAFDGVAQRDCAIVVSPKKALNLRLYEVNPLVVEATPGGGPGQRSTFEDFLEPDTDGFDPFSLETIRSTLDFNAVWLMPVFPVTHEQLDPNTGNFVPNISPGSPYAARNYFAIDERYADANTPAAALTEFKDLVARADSLGLDVFLDVAFNHSGRDTVFGQGAVDAGLVAPADVGARIAERRPAWASSGWNYREHASSPFDLAAFAPTDRRGEHRWYDAGFDWFFGNYSSLGPKPGFGDVSEGGALDERDLFYSDLDPAGGHDFEVENVWNYFAAVVPFWLDQTNNRLGGIRADFAQGLPPRAWEYIINKAKAKKWDFVFLAEVLDPDQVRYRANRHFDIVTTVDHWLYRRNDLSMSELRDSLENEASLYGYNAAVLHNGTSHDEEGNANVWLMAARHAVASAVYGVPMVYMGQPIGVPYKVNFESSWENLKSFWDGANPAVFAMYRRINEARAGQPALRGTARYFLSRRAGGFNDEIFSVARWAGGDVVLAFVNLRDRVVGPDVFAVPDAVPLEGGGARYQAFNLLADDPNAALWPAPRTAADIRGNGVFVRFNFANESQYLSLRKVP